MGMLKNGDNRRKHSEYNEKPSISVKDMIMIESDGAIYFCVV